MRPWAIARATAGQSRLGTVRSHGCTPKPDVIASFQSFLPNSNATYNVGSLTLIAGRVIAFISSSFGLPKLSGAYLRRPALIVSSCLFPALEEVVERNSRQDDH